MKRRTAGGWNEEKANGRKKSRSLLRLVTLTRSCCAQCQSIRHPGLLLMSTGNKSEETGLYFAAWLTCRSRHWPACPCIPPKLTPPELSFTRWESWPLSSRLSRLFIIIFFYPLCCWSLMCISLFISNVLSVQTMSGAYAYKLWNTKGINHCHLMSRSIALGARAWAPCTLSHCFLV